MCSTFRVNKKLSGVFWLLTCACCCCATAAQAGAPFFGITHSGSRAKQDKRATLTNRRTNALDWRSCCATVTAGQRRHIAMRQSAVRFRGSLFNIIYQSINQSASAEQSGASERAAAGKRDSRGGRGNVRQSSLCARCTQARGGDDDGGGGDGRGRHTERRCATSPRARFRLIGARRIHPSNLVCERIR